MSSDRRDTPGPGGRDPLDVDELRRVLLLEGSVWTGLEVSASTTSTNADVVAMVGAGAPEGLVVATEHQTAGRGRLDRRWETPPGAGLMVSVLLRPDGVALPQWTWLPLLTGLAVDLTARDCGVTSGLKWPNDVLVEGRKISGILLERADGPAGPAAVVGIGLNVSSTPDELPVPTATSLAIEGATTVDRGVVLQLLLGHLERLYRPWVASAGDPALLRRDYLEQSVTLGSRVRVELPDGSTLTGVAHDIDPLGRLVVDGRAISAGDVTHVRAVG
ncbi:biotin--[acetyl-CoA-carboxylase] ligase [Aeromicrobium sp.]|uniref:biotin--[acetyl-CoA-carboxylase] ligase n=1 Tax=Aeromicrobium sp. TaxID=1871063 RepID=UPI004034DAEA